MSFITEALTPEERRAKEWSRLQREKEKSERAQKDWEQKEKTYKHKSDYFEWLKKRAKERAEERKEAEKRRLERQEQEANKGTSNIKMPSISDKDRDPTAMQQALSGVASFAGAALDAAARAGIHAAKNRKKKPPTEEPKEPQKLLPPGKEPIAALPPGKGPVGRLEPASGERARRDPRFRKRQAKQRMPQPPKPRSPLQHPDEPIRTRPKIDNTQIPDTTPQVSTGRRARLNPAVKKAEIEKRGGSVSEEFSCWREEFLYELGEMRRKNKKKDDEDYIVDVMKGKNKITIGPKIKDTGLQEGKRDAAANALLTLAFVANAAQSPKDLVRSGHIEGPGIQLMSTMMRKRKKADINLDSGRVSHPARNIKKREQVKEALDKKELLKAIVRKLIDEKKRKNTLLIKGYIGEAKYSKENLQCNKPKADPVGDSETGKSHVVKACEGGTEKLIRFGQRGVKGSPKKKGESKAYANRRKRFKARHAKNIAKGKMSASWWSNSVKW